MVGVFAFGDITIVTDGTVIYDALMIKLGAGKRRSVMTIGAVLARLYGDVVRCHSGRYCTIVTGCAVINNALMTEHRRGKAAGDVTHATILSGRHVIRIFAGSRHTVMTGVAARIRCYGTMVEYGIGKAIGVMAHTAIFGGVRMVLRLADGAVDIMVPIVAGGAVAGDTCVAENRWVKRRVGVAKVAILLRRQMVGVGCGSFANSAQELTVVTTFAATGNRLVNRSQEC